MGLKQIKRNKRIFFLKQFTVEILNNSIREKELKKKIQIEKLKQKFVDKPAPIKMTKSSVLNLADYTPSVNAKEDFKEISGAKKIISKTRLTKNPSRILNREQINYRMRIPKKRHIQRIRKLLMPRKNREINNKLPPKTKLLTDIMPEAQKRPENFVLDEVDYLLKDPSIQSIECPGPGKNLLVKRYNQTNITKTILNQEEITHLINVFSKQAKIPVVGGILKAAVGDLVMSAILSEFVGSRFIINKISAYSMIKG